MLPGGHYSEREMENLTKHEGEDSSPPEATDLFGDVAKFYNEHELAGPDNRAIEFYQDQLDQLPDRNRFAGTHPEHRHCMSDEQALISKAEAETVLEDIGL